MRDVKKRSLGILFFVFMIVSWGLAGQAAALSEQEQAQLSAAAQSCDVEQIEVAASNVVKEAMAAGEEAADAAEQTTRTVFTTAISTCENINEISEAVTIGAVAGAVAAAAAADMDVAAVRQTAAEGAARGVEAGEAEGFEPAGRPAETVRPVLEMPPRPDERVASPT